MCPKRFLKINLYLFEGNSAYIFFRLWIFWSSSIFILIFTLFIWHHESYLLALNDSVLRSAITNIFRVYIFDWMKYFRLLGRSTGKPMRKASQAKMNRWIRQCGEQQRIENLLLSILYDVTLNTGGPILSVYLFILDFDFPIQHFTYLVALVDSNFNSISAKATCNFN